MAVLTKHLEKKSLNSPDEVRTFPRTKIEVFRVGGQTLSRLTLEPGWNWATDLGRAVGKDLCTIDHVGYLISGHMGVRLDDGTELEAWAGDLVAIPPNHQARVIGDEPAVFLEFAGGEAFSKLG